MTTNPWSTDFETGLLDDFDFTIVRSFFAPDAKYNNGETLLLQWEGKTDNIDQPETHVWFPLGKGWVSKDGGKTIVHESGKADKYFVKTSLMAKLIERCVNDFGIGEILASRGGPFEAAPWQGLTFHMKSETITFGAGISDQTKVFPQRFVGAAAEAPVAANPAAAALAKAAAAKVEKPLREQVLDVMRPHKANNDFVSAQSAALGVPGVTDDEELVAQLLDESGLFAEA